jgi:heptose II phosphotransferase
MKNLIKKKYGEYNLYSFEEKYINICKKILEKNYITIKELKNTPRNYVSIIEVNGEKYVYKEPRNEYKLIQRKIMTIFKKGEALNTLVNVNRIMDLGIDSLAKIYCVVNKRKYGMINFSFLLMEYVEENRCKEVGDRNKLHQAIVELKKIHKLGCYHGDFNPSNVILTKDEEIKLIDTQLKKDRFFNYKRHYDMITMQYDSYQEMEYPYNKDMIYYLAYLIKRFKKLKRRMRKK